MKPLLKLLFYLVSVIIILLMVWAPAFILSLWDLEFEKHLAEVANFYERSELIAKWWTWVYEYNE